jgi:mono/diheme cytochrome c family protein
MLAPLLVLLVGPVPPARQEIAAADQALIESGKRVYAEQGCARCHSIAGRGSRRSPLDGVGARLSAEKLKSWIVTPKEQAPQIAGSFQARHANRDLPQPELQALATCLRSLRDELPARKNGVSN